VTDVVSADVASGGASQEKRSGRMTAKSLHYQKRSSPIVRLADLASPAYHAPDHGLSVRDSERRSQSMWTVADEEFLQNLMEDVREEELGEGLDYAVPPRVYRVVHRPPIPVTDADGRVGKRPVFRLGPLISGAHAIWRTLFPKGRSPAASVWVQGGPKALRHFLQQYHLRKVEPPEVHSGHVHANAPGGGRSQHIFYGRRMPPGDFFD
jgi:hypothetical protein